jgi:hypothetical protein
MKISKITHTNITNVTSMYEKQLARRVCLTGNLSSMNTLLKQFSWSSVSKVMGLSESNNIYSFVEIVSLHNLKILFFDGLYTNFISSGAICFPLM